LKFTFKTSNHQAEYEAILVGLSLAQEVGVRVLTCKTDSRLTVGHLNDEFQIKDATLLQYYHLVRNIINSSFNEVKIQHIPRGDNGKHTLYQSWQALGKKENTNLYCSKH